MGDSGGGKPRGVGEPNVDCGLPFDRLRAVSKVERRIVDRGLRNSDPQPPTPNS